MANHSGLTLVSRPEDYFRELVINAMGKQKVSTQPETEFYLVNLLNKFMTTDQLYSRGPEGEVREEPLAIMVKEALEEPKPALQSAQFRHIGDVSLYIAGFFQDSLNRKMVDVDYYIDMGGTAYRRVSHQAEEQIWKLVYSELAEKFGALVEVLAHVSDQTAVRTQANLLRMYELWIRTKSERAAKALHEAGILPNDTLKKSVQ
jgi:hypothetical protein